MSSMWFILFWVSVAVLVYAQVGYPLLARLAALCVRRRTPVPSGAKPRVSVIIPAYNEQRCLRAKLENTQDLEYPSDRLEIVVASDGSTDATVDIARSFEPRIRLLEFPARRGKASVLNDAARVATGEVLCLCDANVMFHPDALAKLVARLQDPRVGAASGDVQLISDESDFGEGEKLYYRIERRLQLDESKLGSMMGVDGGMYVVRRELFQTLPHDTILDDFVTTMRVIQQGKRVVYEPTAVATENGTPTAREEFQRRVRVSAGAAQVVKRGECPPLSRPVELWQLLSHKLVRWSGPLFLVTLLISSLCLLKAGRVYQIALAAQVLAYGLALASAFSLKLRKTGPGGVAFYFAMSHVAMGFGLSKGFLNLQDVAWTRTARSVAGHEIEATSMN